MCLDGACVCLAGLSGADCSEGCVNSCSLRGNCSHGVCTCGGGWQGLDCSVPPFRIDNCAAECAQTCDKRCAASAAASLVEGAAASTIPLDLRGRDLSAAKSNVACLEPCEAMCMTACELRQLEGRGVRQEEQAAAYTGPLPQQTSMLDQSSGRDSVVEAR